MSIDDGGEHETLAPVIPLFGGRVPQRPTSSDQVHDEDDPALAAFAAVDAVFERAPGRRAAAAAPDDAPAGEVENTWHPTWAADSHRSRSGSSEATPDTEAAEKALLKKLRSRSLSVSEARGVLRTYDLDAGSTEQVLAAMEEYGYLDDAALADQLIHTGVDRKAQGRQVIGQTLAKRGIPRDVADAALAALPDDDFERALDFARGKARSLQSLDRDTALRRLTGQLARRGYGGSLAMSAARAALDESPRGSSGVRFR
ncbi:MAG: regulatory protein RecX [Microbacterium sp.]